MMSLKENKKIVLSFDLDFTLIDNREGIVNSFNYALKKFNLPEIRNLEIEKMIGTPLDEMFARVSNLNPLLLSSAFREYYGTKGIYQSHLLPGVMNKIKKLWKESFTLGIITSKKEEMAWKITKYLKIYKYFDYIFGETEEIKSKLDLKIKQLLFDKYSGYNFVVIGDHPNDGMLAKNLNCPFIGVLTGIHKADQLKQINDSKTLIINSLNDLTVNLIYSLL